MDRKELETYIFDTYAVEPDRPWARYPDYLVFRHAGSRKWFALVMGAPREKLGLPGGGAADIVNVKCDPLLAGALRQEPGIYPAYHMSKANWVSALLDGGASGETIRTLVDMSFGLTAPRPKKRKEGRAL